MQAARGAPLNSSGTSPQVPGPDSDPPSPGRPSPGRPTRRHLLLFAVIAVSAYALDVVSKVVAVRELAGEPPVPLVGDVLSLYLTYNSGAAFSFLTGHTEVLSVIAMAAVVLIGWVARRLASTGWAVALGFLLGGVAGNLTDRIVREPGPFRGHVVDFFMLPNFPIFNVADICINIAAGTIVLQALRGVNVDGTRGDGTTSEAHRP